MPRHALTPRAAHKLRLSCLALTASLALAGCAGHGNSNSVANTAPTGTIGPSTLNVADAAIAGGDPSMALSVSQSILSNDPNNVDALVHEGDAYYALGRCPAADAAYQDALKNDSRSAAAETGYGRCLLKVNPAGAEVAFSAAVQDDPGDAEALSDLGIARDLQGNFAGAASAYQQSLMANPGSDATAVNLGLSLALSGQGSEALQYLGPLATGPDATPKIREDYAAALVAAGRPDDARQILSVDMPPDQVNQAMAGFQALIAQAITNPPPPPAPPPTDPEVQTAPVTAVPETQSAAPTPLAPAASTAPDPAPATAAPTPVAEAPPPPPVTVQPAPPPPPVVAASVPTPAAQPAPPPPPQPKATPPVAAEAPAMAPAQPQMTTAAATPASPSPAPAPQTVSTPAAPAAPVVPSPAQVAALSSVPPVPAPAPSMPASPTPASPMPEQAAAQPAVMSVTDGHAAVQIAALNTRHAAQVEWRKVSANAPSLFAGKSPEISKVQVGGQTYYRLRVSGFASHENAAQFCSLVTSAGDPCMPANF